MVQLWRSSKNSNSAKYRGKKDNWKRENLFFFFFLNARIVSCANQWNLHHAQNRVLLPSGPLISISQKRPFSKKAFITFNVTKDCRHSYTKFLMSGRHKKPCNRTPTYWSKLERPYVAEAFFASFSQDDEASLACIALAKKRPFQTKGC